MNDPSLQNRASELLERGFTIFERLHDDDFVERGRVALERRYEALGRPPCFASSPIPMGPDVERSQTGLVLHNTLVHHPEFEPVIAPPAVVPLLRLLLGEAMTLELSSVVIADESRSFFTWHNHVGGPDDWKYRRAGVFPTFERSQRLMTLTYFDDLNDDNGPLLAYPRRISDPTAAPYHEEREDWPGLHEFRIPRGSVVVMEQCTWHAVRRKRTPGLRRLVGAWFRSPEAPPTDYVAPAYTGGGPLLASLLPRAGSESARPQTRRPG